MDSEFLIEDEGLPTFEACLMGVLLTNKQAPFPRSCIICYLILADGANDSFKGADWRDYTQLPFTRDSVDLTLVCPKIFS